jgi:hypothetical protein
MEQSILLATILLEIGMPYLACWLPEPAFATGRDLGTQNEITPNVEITQDRMSKAGIELARAELNEIMQGLEWREDPRMLEAKGWWGVTTYCYPRPEKDFSRIQVHGSAIEDHECQENGYKRRQNAIAITSTYIDILLNTDKASEQHVCAEFHLATNLVHEIAHLVYWQNFKHLNPFMGTEPVVDDQPVMELGLAFVGWLFSGWNPEPIVFKKNYGDVFKYGMRWVKQLGRQPWGRREWEITYSMPFSYVQDIMSQRFWKGTEGKLIRQSTLYKIRVPAPFHYGRYARKAVCKKKQRGDAWMWTSTTPFNHVYPEVNRDDDEDWGNLPPGFPPFGFHDEDWTTEGAENALSVTVPQESQNPQVSGATQTLHRQGSLVREITVVYSGVYDSTTKTIHPFGTARNISHENLSRYIYWPEGVLRSLCAERDLSNFGKKSQLIARLEKFDEENAVSHNADHMSEEESDKTELSLKIRMSMTVNKLKQNISENLLIPTRLQRLQLSPPYNTHLRSRLGKDTTLSDCAMEGWDKPVLLYRVLLDPEEDPGPQARPDESDDIPGYIKHLHNHGGLPDQRKDAEPAFEKNWQIYVQSLRRTETRLEKSNRLQRWALASINTPEAKDAAAEEYRAYIGFLDQVNQNLHKRAPVGQDDYYLSSPEPPQAQPPKQREYDLEEVMV